MRVRVLQTVQTVSTRSSFASENNGVAQTGMTLFYPINPFGPMARFSLPKGYEYNKKKRTHKSVCSLAVRVINVLSPKGYVVSCRFHGAFSYFCLSVTSSVVHYEDGI